MMYVLTGTHPRRLCSVAQLPVVFFFFLFCLGRRCIVIPYALYCCRCTKALACAHPLSGLHCCLGGVLRQLVPPHRPLARHGRQLLRTTGLRFPPPPPCLTADAAGAPALATTLTPPGRWLGRLGGGAGAAARLFLRRGPPAAWRAGAHPFSFHCPPSHACGARGLVLLCASHVAGWELVHVLLALGVRLAAWCGNPRGLDGCGLFTAPSTRAAVLGLCGCVLPRVGLAGQVAAPFV